METGDGVTTESANLDSRRVQNSSSNRISIYRPQVAEDLREVLQLAREYHAESMYAAIPFSDEKVVKAFKKAIGNPDKVLAVCARYQGRTVGLMRAAVGSHYLVDDFRMATAQSIYVAKDIRSTLLGGRVSMKFFRILADWAKAQGAQEVHVHVGSAIAPERSDRMLKRLGYRLYGGNYIGKLR